MASMTAEKTSWRHLPAEVRIMILDYLLQDDCNLAGFATVSQEWQEIIERHNFARIKLTSSRLATFDSMTRRNRALVHYIWLCLELDEYDCSNCASTDPYTPEWDRVATAFKDLFSTLGTWEPNGNLLLNISAHSPSDSEQHFKYLTFVPDMPSDKCEQVLCEKQLMQAKRTDKFDVTGDCAACMQSRKAWRRPLLSNFIDVFDRIFSMSPLSPGCNLKDENGWCQRLPLVPAVTGLLLRQLTRRNWRPVLLEHLIARFPRLQEIHYEPWRRWNAFCQRLMDGSFPSLFESLISSRLRKLVLFENFNEIYARKVDSHPWRSCDPVRIPNFDISQAVAKASLELEQLSASFIVDASYFFQAREPSWKWSRLNSLALTSRLLSPGESPIEIDSMLQAAASMAMKMPSLKTMEIWNGRKGLAMLFRYQLAGGWQPAVITCRGTWEFDLRPPVIQAWEAVTAEHHAYGIMIVKELLVSGDKVKSHGDAIHHLKLVNEVIRPVSLRQIRMEQRYCRL